MVIWTVLSTSVLLDITSLPRKFFLHKGTQKNTHFCFFLLLYKQKNDTKKR